MSYQVLARKWRPQSFHELMGQEHVKQALVNALNEQRLHHAYLFTGTRGVGKTTIARIFAKSLNCEEGVTSTPCGQCSTCQEVEIGKFIDLIEIDAASRTKVEDTREILDNVQYAPTRGRYKVYLIDEVHMLSKHSFNALLKTLEEPPEHVKFLLATTDPQKLPVTILSRCLQFNLNAMAPNQITQQLEKILPEESVKFEPHALEVLAKAARGSMRDALSLTDQAIAQTKGELTASAVQQMLGLMDASHAVILLSALIERDGEALLAEVEEISLKNGNFTSVLDDLIALIHAIQLTQLVPQAAQLSQFEKEDVKLFAEQLDAQRAQLIYQFLLNGKKDLTWAPDAKLGFEMVMLRLLAFEKAPSASVPQATQADGLRSLLKKNKPAGSAEPSHNEGASLASIPQRGPLQPSVEEQNSDSQSSNMRNVEKVHSMQPVSEVTPQHTSAQPMPSMSGPSGSVERHEAPPQHPPVSPSDTGDMSGQMMSEYESVMAQAEQLGHTPNAPMDNKQADNSQVENTQLGGAHSHQPDAVTNSNSQSESSLAAHQSQSNSAIARILKNRNISGAGKLSTGASPAKKPESAPQPARALGGAKPVRETSVSSVYQTTSPDLSGNPVAGRPAQGRPVQSPATQTTQSSAPVDLPWHDEIPSHNPVNTPFHSSTQSTNEIADLSQSTGKEAPTFDDNHFVNTEPMSSMPARAAKPVPFKERHQTVEANLAPELVEQLTPQPSRTSDTNSIVEIPSPDNFVSPISQTKFAHQTDDWAANIEAMELGGRLRQFCLHSTFHREGESVTLQVDGSQQHLESDGLKAKLTKDLSVHFNQPITLTIEFVAQQDNTPFQVQMQLDAQRLEEAKVMLREDPVVSQFAATFNAQLDESTVQAL